MGVLSGRPSHSRQVPDTGPAPSGPGSGAVPRDGPRRPPPYLARANRQATLARNQQHPDCCYLSSRWRSLPDRGDVERLARAVPILFVHRWLGLDRLAPGKSRAAWLPLVPRLPPMLTVERPATQ